MKRINYLIVSFLLVLGTLNTYSQTLHALIFVNANERGREIDRRADMTNMSNFWKEISSAIGYKYSYSIYSDNRFTASNTISSISNLKIAKNDIVVYYYSGHGYNDESNIWQTLSFKDKQFREIAIVKALRKVNSNAKLTLCIADCCNKQSSSRNGITNSYGNDPSALKKLLTGFKGKKTIIMSASKQGQYSWSNMQLGALFGIALRSAINNVEYSSATWDKVLKNAQSLAYRYSDGKQVPQYSITQSGDPFE